jgi:hypothetical protein
VAPQAKGKTLKTEEKLMHDAMKLFTPAFLIKHFTKETPLKTQKAIEHYI